MTMRVELKWGTFRERALSDLCPLTKSQGRQDVIWEWTAIGEDGSMSAHGMRCKNPNCPMAVLLSVSAPGQRELERARYRSERTLYAARVMAIVALVSIATNALLVVLLLK